MTVIKKAPRLQDAKQIKTERKCIEIKRVYEYLKTNTATATQVALALNIHRPNVCRYKRKLERASLLKEVKKTICPATKHRASLLTTDITYIQFLLNHIKN